MTDLRKLSADDDVISSKILEAIHIRKEKPAHNRDKGLDLDPIQFFFDKLYQRHFRSYYCFEI